MIDPQIWQEIPHEQVRHAVISPDPEEGAHGDKEPNITEQDEFGIFCLIEGTRRVEVVDTIAKAVRFPFSAAFMLPLVEVMPANVGEQIGRPATDLLTNEVDGCGNGCLLGKFVNLMHEFAKVRSIRRPGFWGHVPCLVRDYQLPCGAFHARFSRKSMAPAKLSGRGNQRYRSGPC